jgi:hypothetical protein
MFPLSVPSQSGFWPQTALVTSPAWPLRVGNTKAGLLARHFELGGGAYSICLSASRRLNQSKLNCPVMTS